MTLIDNYDASNIEILEGLDRCGIVRECIGGTDDRALHHLAAEILDNSMDEAVAGHANRIEITLSHSTHFRSVIMAAVCQLASTLNSPTISRHNHDNATCWRQIFW